MAPRPRVAARQHQLLRNRRQRARRRAAAGGQEPERADTGRHGGQPHRPADAVATVQRHLRRHPLEHGNMLRC